MLVMVKNSVKLCVFLHSLSLSWVAGLIGNNACDNTWRSFYQKIILNAFLAEITGKLPYTSTS